MGGGGGRGAAAKGGISAASGGMMFEGLYQEPSLGHLVGLIRFYVHRMEVVSKEEVCVIVCVCRVRLLWDWQQAQYAIKQRFDADNH